MTDGGGQMLMWAATGWLHGFLLFLVVLAADQAGLLRDLTVRQTAWRIVLLAPLLSTLLHVGGFHGPAVLTIALPSPDAAATPLAQPAPAATVGWPVVAGWLWALFVTLVVVRFLLQLRGLQAFRRTLERHSDQALTAEANKLAAGAGLRGVTLWRSRQVQSPLAMAGGGIVMPDWVADIPSAQQIAMLAHEIAHLRRRDPEWRAVLSAVSLAGLAPHRSVALRRLDAVAEYACDAWAARATDRRSLLESLATCLEHRSPAPSLTTSMSGSPLVERARRLADGELRACAWNAGARGLSLTALVGASILLPAWTLEPAAATPQRASGVRQVASSVREQYDALPPDQSIQRSRASPRRLPSVPVPQTVATGPPSASAPRLPGASLPLPAEPPLVVATLPVQPTAALPVLPPEPVVPPTLPR